MTKTRLVEVFTSHLEVMGQNAEVFNLVMLYHCYRFSVGKNLNLSIKD